MSHIFDCLDGVSSRDRLAIFNHHHQAAGNQPKEAAAFNLLVVNQYQMDSDKSEDYIPWHDDKMKELSHRSDADAAAAPVLSLSLGESQVFALCPKEDSPTWHKVFSEIENWPPGSKVPTSRKRTDLMNSIEGKVALCLDHGDILLMTGDTQEHCMSVRGPSAT